MVSKDSILQVLGRDLDTLIKSYENQITQLRRENQSLLSKKKELERENQDLQTQVLRSSRVQVDIRDEEFFQSLFSQMINGISCELIDKWFLSSTEMTSYILLLTLKNMVQDQDYEMSRYIIDCLAHNQAPLFYESKQNDDIFEEILIMIFLNDNQDINSQFDELLMSALDLLKLLHKTTKKKLIIDFVKDYLADLTDNIFYLNEPLIMTNFLRVCFVYHLIDELREILTYMLKIEWGFLDSKLSKEEFTFLLWYSYLFNLDQELLEKAVFSMKWFQNSKDLSLYYYLQDCLNQKISHKKSTFKLKKQELQASRLLINVEIEEIVAKIEKELIAFAPKPNRAPLYDSNLRVVKDNYFDTVIKQIGLKEKLMTLPLYQSINDNFASKYLQVMVWMSEDGRAAYLSEKHLREIKKQYYPVKPKVKEYSMPIVKQMTTPATTKISDKFKWPNTDIGEKTHAEELDDTKLNEHSALKLMGYQITGLTRDKRWSILKNAVPTLGLKKVATIIAYNVKLRKGQKNGMNKFQYAITEWEHDLKKLKETYYKKDFKWPIS
ncbi:MULTISPECIES: hypothetical protein [Bacillus]|uniref:Uncharacterized protein n=1 Tax=Bacillus infantis NRRL B-14911 TaxID=1367477 RepID=U5LIL3_9BACI|nr:MULTISPECIES: hypothetical protein [Bacillus]AGX06472.1 hypothetical protein N288_23165 [Bacillus infantis NRRL B-14911]